MAANDSRMRPELNRNSNSESNLPCPTGGTAYWLIYSAVKHQDRLIHGKLHDKGAHCAIGSYWEDNPKTALPTALIDEVAMVNDSVPHLTPTARKRHVMQWLRWKLKSLGFSMPGKMPAKR